MTDIQPKMVSFEEAFNQAINSLDLKGTLVLLQALSTKALHTLEEESKRKAKVNHILTN